MVIAERFGTSHQYDILLIGIAAPIFFNLVLVNATNFLTVPLLSRKMSSGAEAEGWRSFWSLFNSLLAIVALIVVSVIIAAPWLVKAVAPTLESEAWREGVYYCRLISALILLGFLESFLRSALNIKKDFIFPATGTIILNIIAIAAIYALSAKMSVLAILLGLVIGTLVQDCYLFFRLMGFNILKYFHLEFFPEDIRHAFASAGIIVMVELLSRTYFLIDRYFASEMVSGVVSALNYCSLLVMLPVSIAAFAISSVTFPYMSDHAGENREKDFANLLHSTLRLSLLIGIPSGIFYLLFARDLTAAVFFRGAFDAVSLAMTSRLLVLLAPYLICLFLYTILMQACYAAGKQKAVLIITVISIVIKIVSTALFAHWFDYPGIALSTTITSATTVILMVVVLSRGHRITNISDLFSGIAKILLASLPIAILGYFYGPSAEFERGMSLLVRFRIIPAMLISLVGFVTIAYFIDLREVRELINKMRSRLF